MLTPVLLKSMALDALVLRTSELSTLKFSEMILSEARNLLTRVSCRSMAAIASGIYPESMDLYRMSS
jgi:hypothetical protein